MYVLNSTVLIDFLRGRPAITRVAALRKAGGRHRYPMDDVTVEHWPVGT